jgi:hypothetical protein
MLQRSPNAETRKFVAVDPSDRIRSPSVFKRKGWRADEKGTSNSGHQVPHGR